MSELSDPRSVQNDWRTDPDNPEAQHKEALRQFHTQCLPGTRVPDDIAALIREHVEAQTTLNTWFRAMGISDIEREMYYTKLAYKAAAMASQADQYG